MKSFVTVADWLGIPKEHREIFRLKFTVNKSTGLQVIDNVVTCDGSTGEDLKVVSIGAMILALWEKDKGLMKQVGKLLEDCNTLCDNLLKLTIETFIPHVETTGIVGIPVISTVNGTSGAGHSAIFGTEEVKPRRRGRPARETGNLQAGVSGV